MIVTPDGRPLDQASYLASVLSSPILRKANEDFLSGRLLEVPRSLKNIYVLQGEQAFVDFHKGGVAYIGSDEATTCVIVVVICRKANKAWAAHYDQGSSRGDLSFKRFANCFVEPELYLVGGYAEPSNAGRDVCIHVLKMFHEQMSQTFALQLACIYNANVDEHGAPRSRQLAVHCDSGKAICATFGDRGPSVSRRLAYNHCYKGPFLLSIFDSTTDTYRLPGFVSKMPTQRIFDYSELLLLPGDELLQCYSTSPSHESDRFVPDMRALFEWLIDAQDMPDPKEEHYRWCSEAGWQLLPRGHSQESWVATSGDMLAIV